MTEGRSERGLRARRLTTPLAISAVRQHTAFKFLLRATEGQLGMMLVARLRSDTLPSLVCERITKTVIEFTQVGQATDLINNV